MAHRTEKSLRFVQALGWALRQRLVLEAKGQLATKRRTLNPGRAAYFNGMTPLGIGRFRCSPAEWLAGLGRFNFRLARIPTEASGLAGTLTRWHPSGLHPSSRQDGQRTAPILAGFVR